MASIYGGYESIIDIGRELPREFMRFDPSGQVSFTHFKSKIWILRSHSKLDQKSDEILELTGSRNPHFGSWFDVFSFEILTMVECSNLFLRKKTFFHTKRQNKLGPCLVRQADLLLRKKEGEFRCYVLCN